MWLFQAGSRCLCFGLGPEEIDILCERFKPGLDSELADPECDCLAANQYCFIGAGFLRSASLHPRPSNSFGNLSPIQYARAGSVYKRGFIKRARDLTMGIRLTAGTK